MDPPSLFHIAESPSVVQIGTSSNTIRYHNNLRSPLENLMISIVFHYGLCKFTDTLGSICNLLSIEIKSIIAFVRKSLNHNELCKPVNEMLWRIWTLYEFYLNSHSLVYNASAIMCTNRIGMVLK